MQVASGKWGLGVLLLLLLVACGNGVAGKVGADLLFREEFVPGQTARWEIEGDDLGHTAVLNEQLVINLEAPNILQYSALTDQSFQDFILEVDARQVSGELSNSYGVLFRMQGPSQFYRLEITGEGNYVLERRNADGSWTRFVDEWTPSEAIKQGYNVTNRIRIEANGAQVSAYVNGVLVGQFNDATYTAGQIGLDAGTFGSPEMQAAFDNVVVWQP
ncbi:MAG: DUF1080 domain-containing protein [Chloroflexi bacterium]|nr:DUF1080 domain-containing protein [Chloroflexota bacterium]